MVFLFLFFFSLQHLRNQEWLFCMRFFKAFLRTQNTIKIPRTTFRTKTEIETQETPSEHFTLLLIVKIRTKFATISKKLSNFKLYGALSKKSNVAIANSETCK